MYPSLKPSQDVFGCNWKVEDKRGKVVWGQTWWQPRDLSRHWVGTWIFRSVKSCVNIRFFNQIRYNLPVRASYFFIILLSEISKLCFFKYLTIHNFIQISAYLMLKTKAVSSVMLSIWHPDVLCKISKNWYCELFFL